MTAVITKNSVATAHFTLTLADGTVADSTRVAGKAAKFIMGDGSLSPNLEAQLLGLGKGDTKQFTLPPEDVFGNPDPDHIHQMERSRFKDVEIEVGAVVAFTQPDGVEWPGVISAVKGDKVTVDFNHPLAGKALTFDIEILDVEKKK